MLPRLAFLLAGAVLLGSTSASGQEVNVEPAFPGLSFSLPIGVAPLPGSKDALFVVEKGDPVPGTSAEKSGDKGDKANIGIIARRPEYLPYIYRALTEAAVTGRFAHFLADTGPGKVERFLLPGSHAINFLLHDVLGGGGVASIRNDPQAKGYAQLLLDCPIPVTAAIAETLA